MHGHMLIAPVDLSATVLTSQHHHHLRRSPRCRNTCTQLTLQPAMLNTSGALCSHSIGCSCSGCGGHLAARLERPMTRQRVWGHRQQQLCTPERAPDTQPGPARPHRELVLVRVRTEPGDHGSGVGCHQRHLVEEAVPGTDPVACPLHAGMRDEPCTAIAGILSCRERWRYGLWWAVAEGRSRPQSLEDGCRAWGTWCEVHNTVDAVVAARAIQGLGRAVEVWRQAEGDCGGCRLLQLPGWAGRCSWGWTGLKLLPL